MIFPNILQFVFATSTVSPCTRGNMGKCKSDVESDVESDDADSTFERGIRRRWLTLHGRKGLQTPVDSTFSSCGPRTIQIIENVDIIQIFASVHLLLRVDHPRYMSALRKGMSFKSCFDPFQKCTYLDIWGAGAIPKLNFLVSGRISFVMSTFSVFGLSYGPQVTGAPAKNFALKRVKIRYLTLFRATKNCVVICRASLVYVMGYPFRSAV